MKCPGNETLIDLASGDLPDSEMALVMAHVKECSACKVAVRQFLLITGELREEVDRHPCPSSETIHAYHRRALSNSERDEVKRHLEECERCQDHLEFLESPDSTASAPSLAAAIEELGRDLARRVLRELSPKSESQLALLWEKIVGLVLERLDNGLGLQAFKNGPALVGAMPLTPSDDPEIRLTAITCATALAVAHSMICPSPSPMDIQDVARQAAADLGAGPNMSRRLARILEQAATNTIVSAK